MSLKIFLSHAWRDKGLATFKAIEARLRSAGHDVWVDKRGIEFGESITPRLDAAIAAADVVLVLWSENAAQSEAVRHEITTTLRLEKLLVPCRISALEPGAHELLRDRKYLRFDANLEFGLLQLSQFLIRLNGTKHAALRGDAAMQEQVAALNEALTEVEDSLYRREAGASGNAASDTYIHSMLEAGKKLMETSRRTPPEEKARMLQFFSLVQEIARAHPDPKDDALKEARMVEAIGLVDPDGRSAMLQGFKQALAQSVATRRGTSPTTPPHQPAPPSSPASPPMSSPLQAHIATVRQSPNAEAALRQRLQQLLAATPAQVPLFERGLNQAIDAIPALFDALAQASQQAGIAHLMAPLLQQAQAYFFAANDLVPDHHGTLGLLDDAYLAHAFLYQVNATYQAHTGRPLLAHDPTQTLQVLRAVLGPMITQQLDQAVVAAVNQVAQQSYYQQLGQQHASLDMSGGRTGGPGSWGGSWEDEMARKCAELGISF